MIADCGEVKAASNSVARLDICSTIVLQIHVMKTISLRDANQKFARLVREVEQRRRPVVVTRRGLPVVTIVPFEAESRRLGSDQARALDRILARGRGKSTSGGWKFDRDELYDD